MRNIFDTLLVIFFVVAIIVGACFLYFASQFSATYTPLKKYNYKVSALDLQDVIFNLDKSDPTVDCIITDTVGVKGDQAYYMHLKKRRRGANYSFYIKYDDKKNFWSDSVNSEIKLNGAFDSEQGVGGYRIENIGVENLIKIFEKEFIDKLDKEMLVKVE